MAAICTSNGPARFGNYVYPVIGDLPVQAVDVGLVLKVLEPIWADKTETASRVRGRIESILDWARVRGYRSGENPARWRGHLDHLLPAKSKVKRVQHHRALPYVEIGGLVQELRAQQHRRGGRPRISGPDRRATRRGVGRALGRN